MTDRYMTVSRFDNTASRLTVTPTQIRVTLARGDRHEAEILDAAPKIAEMISGDLTRRGTFRHRDGRLTIHMTTRRTRNRVPGQKFVIKNGALV